MLIYDADMLSEKFPIFEGVLEVNIKLLHGKNNLDKQFFPEETFNSIGITAHSSIPIQINCFSNIFNLY